MIDDDDDDDDDNCGSIGGMRIGRGNRCTRRKPASVPLCLPQIPHDLTRARTRAAAVGSRRLTAWAMARPYTIYSAFYPFYPEAGSSVALLNVGVLPINLHDVTTQNTIYNMNFHVFRFSTGHVLERSFVICKWMLAVVRWSCVLTRRHTKPSAYVTLVGYDGNLSVVFQEQ
jgi:hypothetical protein